MPSVPESPGGEIGLRVIGRIHTPFVDTPALPVEPARTQGAGGQVLADEPSALPLTGTGGFERVGLVTWQDRATASNPGVVPHRKRRKRGGSPDECRVDRKFADGRFHQTADSRRERRP